MVLFVVLFLSLVHAFVAENLSYRNSSAISFFSPYDTSQAQISLWLSAAAYCPTDTYLSRTFKGPTTGFVATYHIQDTVTDTQGFVGYLPSDKSIYVSFRGSTDYRNWATNLNTLKTSYTSFPECKCEVHKGFYAAEQKVIAGVVSAVKSLQSKLSGYAVKVTGHSLGAALAQLTSMDLLKAGISNTVYDFGQPRTGDKAYSDFATARVPTWRVVHNQDQVPHLPFSTQMDFYHVCREEFEDVAGKMKTCDASCEDTSCAAQFKFADTNWDDHSIYLGMHVGCDTV